MNRSILQFAALVLVIGVISLKQEITVAQGIDGSYRSPLIGEWTISRLDCIGHDGNDDGRFLDIFLPSPEVDYGMPVYSSGDGRVDFADWSDGGYGYNVVVTNNEVGSRYAHLSKIYVQEGQQVKKGDLLGLIGMTGGTSTGYHLHWEMWPLNGVQFDLIDYMVGAQAITLNEYARGLGQYCVTNQDVGTITGASRFQYDSCPEFYNRTQETGFNYVVLFDHKDCRGNAQVLPYGGNAGWDLTGYFNDRTRSIYVPPGYSVIVNAHADNRNVLYNCHAVDMWNLDIDHYDDAPDTNPNPNVDNGIKLGWQGNVDPNGYNMISFVTVRTTSTCPSNVQASILGPSRLVSSYNTHIEASQGGGQTLPGWLLEFSKAERPPLEVEIHTRVDAASDYSAHRVLVDGQNIGETAAAEQYITWNTFGWADGYHTLRVEYRRVSDNGNWANALYHEEQFYLSPNRNGTAPCDGRDGAQLVSGSDCIILTQTFPGLDVIGWNDRSNLVVTARGYEAWLEYQWTPVIVAIGQTMSVGSNISSVELRTPAPPPPPPPQSAFTVDANTVYLFPLNEGSGTQTVDIASGLTGTLGSGTAWIPGRFGNALLFPNPNDGRGVTTAPFEVCPLTVELWARINNDSPGRLAGQIGSNNNGGPNKWMLAVSGRRPKFEVWFPTGSQWITSAVEMQYGTWHYIMATYNCSTREAELYLDNQLVGQFVADNAWGSGPTTFEIGAVEGIYRCACEIDDVRISNTIRLPSTEPTATPTIITSPTATMTQPPTLAPTQAPLGVELLPEPLVLAAEAGSDEEAVSTFDESVLVGKDTVRVTYNLHGLCALGGDASAFIFNQAEWMYVSLSDYGQNCLDGVQTVDIPLTDFWNHADTIQINLNEPIGGIRARFWYDSPWQVEILSAIAFALGGQPTPTATPTATLTTTATEVTISTASPTATFTSIPTATETPVLTNTPVGISEVELLSAPWYLSGTESQEAYQEIDENILMGRDAVRITYNLHGICALGGDASAIIFNQYQEGQSGDWRYISLSDYGNNCQDGTQVVEIPLSDFGLNLSEPVGILHVRFWYADPYQVGITSIVAFDSPNL